MEMGQIPAGEARVSKPMRPFSYILRVNLEGNETVTYNIMCNTSNVASVVGVPHAKEADG
jgi:hypothetical protein